MSKIIVTAATAAEIAPFRSFLEERYEQSAPSVFVNGSQEIHLHISGVGMMATAFSLGTAFAAQQFDAAIQAGIAGAFDTAIPLGTVVAVASEQYGDLGAEDNGKYIDIFELGFLDKNGGPFTEGKLFNRAPFDIGQTLPLVSSLSVNTVSGQVPTIEARKAMHNTGIESMEGLAFHYACLMNDIPFLQLRAISNYVTPRNKADWKIKPAIDKLNEILRNTFALHK